LEKSPYKLFVIIFIYTVPDGVIEFLSLPYPSSRTMALKCTRPLTEQNAKNLPGVGGEIDRVSACVMLV
jgi:hypothetical protein